MSTLKTTNIAHPSSASNNIVLDSSARVLVGTSTAYGDYYGAAETWIGNFQVARNATNAVAQFSNWNSTVSSAYGGTQVYLSACKSGTVGTHSGGALTNGDQIGTIVFNASDGTNFRNAAWIQAAIDGTSGTADVPGRLVFSTTADGASSPSEQMRIRSNGMIGLGCIPDGNPSTTGVQTGGTGEGYLIAARNTGNVLYVHRKNDDGNLVEFWQASTVEGTISVSGTTVSYNGAHLSRWSQIPGIDPHDKDQRPEILRGTVMSNLDEMCDWIDPETDEPQANEQLNKTKISDVEGDKNVAGVFQAWDDDDDTWVNDYYLAMTGDFVIRIAAGVTVERGDLLMSAGDGTAKPQDDDIIRSKTIAKVTSTNVSCTYDDGSYCVPCVLMAC